MRLVTFTTREKTYDDLGRAMPEMVDRYVMVNPEHVATVRPTDILLDQGMTQGTTIEVGGGSILVLEPIATVVSELENDRAGEVQARAMLEQAITAFDEGAYPAAWRYVLAVREALSS